VLQGYFAGENGEFSLRGTACRARFDASGVHFGFPAGGVSITFPGSARGVRIQGTAPLSARITFLSGARVAQLPAWGSVVYREIYPGIDMYYRISRSHLKSEFAVAPGGDPSTIRMRYEGVARTIIGDDGSVVAETQHGTIRDAPPEIYQERNGRRGQVPGGYRVFADGTIGFWLGSYDPARPLIIDPVLSFSTYFGGGGQDAATAIAVDGAGNIYVAGWSTSPDLPVTGSIQPRIGGGVDAFVAKISAAGALIYCTYLGGSGDDRAFGIAVDAEGNAYVTGWTYSANFPLAGVPRQSHLMGGRDAFVAKLNASGTGVIYSTYLGGSGNDAGRSIAVDPAGNAYVGGETSSSDFPVLSAFQSASGGQQDGFIAKLNSQGSELLYSTYLGGMGDDNVAALALDTSGNVYVTGGTASPNFPAVNAFQPRIRGGQDAFVAKLGPSGTTLIYSTYLGGSGGTVGMPECGTGIDVDGAGNAYVTGTTSSLDFPVVAPLQNSLNGSLDAFIAKVNPAGNALVYSTYLGGSGVSIGTAVHVSSTGEAYVAGYTFSPDFPVVNPVQTGPGGDYDGFVVHVNAAGTALVFGTLLGGYASDSANALALDSADNVYVAGQTASYNFPLQDPIQSAFRGIYNGFALKLVSRSGTLTATPNPIQVCDGSGVGMTTLSWNASGVSLVSLRGASPNGGAFSPTSPPSGSATTGKWVNDGTVFYLQDISGGLPLTAANTLATVTIHLTTAGCAPSRSGTLTATPNPIQVCDGSGVGMTTLSWNASGVSSVSLRGASPNGAAFSPTSPPSGSATTGKWVNDGTVFYLQDISGGLPLTAANTLAAVIVSVTTAGCQGSP
jgi:hypothetical protein